MNVISRNDAILAGQRTYFTGKPCKRNHLAARYVVNGVCIECQHPKVERTQLAVITTPGEIQTPQVVRQLTEFQLARIDLERRKLELRARQVEIAHRKAAYQLERPPTQHLTYRRGVMRSRMIPVFVTVHPLDYSSVAIMIWAFAAKHDPKLKPEDVVIKQLLDCRVKMRCFPEDHAEIIRITNQIWTDRNTITMAEVERKRLEVIRNLELAVDSEDNGEPEGDPT